MPNPSDNGARTHYAVIKGKRVPLDYESARQAALNAHLLALGDPERAQRMLDEYERAQAAQRAANTRPEAA